MSPTQSEKVVNRPLSGSEVKSYLKSICDRLLDAEGMLSPNIAYGRLSGSIKLTLKFENSFFPESITTIEVSQEREIPPGVKIESPLEAGQQVAEFTMDNPNAERVRLGLPVPVETKQLDGTKQIEHVLYPADQVEDLPEQHVIITDTTEQGKKELGI